MDRIDDILYRLSKSNFRNSFRLKENDIKYINDKGMDKIRQHAYDFINKRLAPEVIYNDGRQTPMKGHPVFISQHACACCCRGCLEKWHHIPKGRKLTSDEIDYIVNMLMTWIERKIKL